MAGLFVDASAFRNHQAAAGFYAELFETRTVLVTTSLDWHFQAMGFSMRPG